MTTEPALQSVNRARRRAVWALLATAACWSVSFPLGKAIALIHERLVPGGSEVFITCSTIWPRFVLATALLALVAGRALGGATRAEWRQGLGLAGFLSAGLLLQVDGLRRTDASTSAFLTQCYVVLVPLWVFGRRRRMPTPRVLWSIVLVVVGVAILADPDWRRLRIGLGESETLVATVFFAGQILWLERAEFRGNRPLVATTLMCAGTGAVFLVAAALTAPEAAALAAPFRSGPWVTFVVVVAIACTFIAFTLMNTFQSTVGASEAGVIYATEPLWVALLALFLPAWLSVYSGLDYVNESLTERLLLGGGLITAANLVLHLRRSRPPARSTVGTTA